LPRRGSPSFAGSRREEEEGPVVWFGLAKNEAERERTVMEKERGFSFFDPVATAAKTRRKK
jgi:hypothetical protein